MALPISDKIAQSTARTLEAAHISCRDTINCALSGGVDSMVLLHLLVLLRQRFGFTLIATHVHHGLSPNADRWAHFCAEQCIRLNVPHILKRVSVDLQHPAGLEASARIARLQALTESDADWLAFGHHQDDQAETQLFRLFRGSGVIGASAMTDWEKATPGQPGKIRPLLSTRRREIVTYAHHHALEWVEDESNQDCRFSRNALRNRIFPVIEKYFPSAVASLARASGHFRDAACLLDDLAEIDYASCASGQGLSRLQLRRLPDARIRNLLRYCWRLTGSQVPTAAQLSEFIRQLRQNNSNSFYIVFDEMAGCVYRDRVWMEPVTTFVPERRRWKGEETLSWGGAAVNFSFATGEGLALKHLENRCVELGPPGPALKIRLDPKRPTKNLKKLCQEAGIPYWKRATLPVLYVDGRAVWIGNLGIACDVVKAEKDEPGLVPLWPVYVQKQ